MITILKNNKAAEIMLQQLIDDHAPTLIEPLSYNGLSAGSEFLTYAATKLYFALDLTMSGQALGGAGRAQATEYDETNAVKSLLSPMNISYNSIEARMNYNNFPAEFHIRWFSRIQLLSFVDLKFIGYRLTIP